MWLKNLTSILCGLLVLTACQPQKPPKTSTEDHIKSVQQQQYLAEFEQWKNSQDPEQLKRYQQVFVTQLKQQPSLYELTVNAHPLSTACEQYRFAPPPEKYWTNVLQPLLLIEQLQKAGLYANYKIVSVYRSQAANHCIGGAKASQHLNNYAVDFQTLDESLKPYPDDDLMDQKLCNFWHQYGRKPHLGLGLYGKQRFHIDTQGYRTWGLGFKSLSSPCLKP